MKKIMGLNGNSNSDMEELAKKTTDGDFAELANIMNDFFLSVSDHSFGQRRKCIYSARGITGCIYY